MYSIDKLFKQCEPFDVVSFDIFDTLLKRDLQFPTDVFRVVEHRYDSLQEGAKSEFYRKRCDAEKQARTKSMYDEVTFDEIYREIDYSLKEKEVFKKFELEVESSVLHRNSIIANLFDKCAEAGKSIYVVSDMYLPQGHLELILKREGITKYKKLFLSCVYRKTKRSGELFRALCKYEKISPKSIIHIGDSIYADCIGARRAGLKGIHIKRNPCNTLYIKTPSDGSGLSERSLCAFINTRVPNFKNRGKKLGYEALGPIIYAYCRWIHESLPHKTGQEKIWFVARDMYLFHNAYRRMYGNAGNEEYIYLSRKSLRPVYAKAVNCIAKSGDVFARGLYSAKQIVEYMGYSLDEAFITPNTDMDVKKYDIRKLEMYPEIVAALSSKSIHDNEEKLAKLGKEYLLEHGLGDHDIVLADVGWHGTTQFILQKIQKQINTNKKIYGMYLGCLDGTKEKVGVDNYSALIFDENDISLFKKGIILFECLILAPHGSTIRYKSDNGYLSPVFGGKVCVPQFIKDVQEGAMAFIDDFRGSVLSDVVDLSPKNISKSFEAMLCNPHREELESIGNLEYENFYCNKMAAPKRLSYYIH